MILTDVPEDSAAVTEETFGPTITVRRVANLEEGIQAPAAPGRAAPAAPGRGGAGRGGSRPAVADRERSRMGPIGPRDPSALRVADYHHWLADGARPRRVMTENHPEWECFPISIANPL